MYKNPTPTKKILLSWSTGKDCAWALHRLRSCSEYADFEIVGLLTTFNETVGRVAMHSTRLEIALAQSFSLDLPLWRVDLPSPCSNEVYSKRMAILMREAKKRGVTHIAYGDLWLKDVRAYREACHEGTGITPLFPIWVSGRDDEECRDLSRQLASDMVKMGHRAILITVDTKQLGSEFCGREFDASFLGTLPPMVDHCGEKGEFHTVAFGGPAFRGNDLSLRVVDSEPVVRDQFVYADVALVAGNIGFVEVLLDAKAFADSDVPAVEWERGAALGEKLCPSK